MTACVHAKTRNKEVIVNENLNYVQKRANSSSNNKQSDKRQRTVLKPSTEKASQKSNRDNLMEELPVFAK